MEKEQTEQERNEKAGAALKQLLICARAECQDCTLVPEPEQWKQCVQVIDTCEEILREQLGLTEKGDDDGTETE